MRIPCCVDGYIVGFIVRACIRVISMLHHARMTISLLTLANRRVNML